jgi:hypothetical protein
MTNKLSVLSESDTYIYFLEQHTKETKAKEDSPRLTPTELGRSKWFRLEKRKQIMDFLSEKQYEGLQLSFSAGLLYLELVYQLPLQKHIDLKNTDDENTRRIIEILCLECKEWS